MKKERATMSDEARERMLIAEQIERAKADAGEDEGPGLKSGSPPVDEGLKRDEGEKVVLSLSAKPTLVALSSASAATSEPVATDLKLNPLKSGINIIPLKVNPLKRSNVFKAVVASNPSQAEGDKTKRLAAPISAAEKLILEDQDRKRRRIERQSVA